MPNTRSRTKSKEQRTKYSVLFSVRPEDTRFFVLIRLNAGWYKRGSVAMGDLSKRVDALSLKRQALLQLLLAEKGKQDAQTIPRRSASGPGLLSFAQERLWFLDQLTPGNPSYNLPVALRLDGQLDITALRRSFEAVVRRHEVLRTT